jgi:glycosyltransferase involved in cell wall biosynthesis
MAAGKPVILAIDGVIRDVVEEADAGIFVPPGDPHALAAAIQMLMNNPERGRQMGRNGRKLIEDRFDRAKLANKIYEIMEGMIDETNR